MEQRRDQRTNRGSFFSFLRKAVWHLNARETHCYVCWIWYNTDNLLLMAAILWIVTTFACVRQPSSFSVSTTRQWPLFTLLQDYEHNETLLKLSKHSSCAEWTELVIKHAAEIHTVRACGFKPSCVLVSQCLYLSFLSHVVKSPIPLCMSIQSARPVQTRWTLSKQEKKCYPDTRADSCCFCLTVWTEGLNDSFQILCQWRVMVDARIQWKSWWGGFTGTEDGRFLAELKIALELMESVKHWHEPHGAQVLDADLQR